MAQTLHDDAVGDRYAVLVVRRGKRSAVPAGLDLLVDPVLLYESGRLRREEDGYTLDYLSRDGDDEGRPTGPEPISPPYPQSEERTNGGKLDG